MCIGMLPSMITWACAMRAGSEPPGRATGSPRSLRCASRGRPFPLVGAVASRAAGEPKQGAAKVFAARADGLRVDARDDTPRAHRLLRFLHLQA